MIQWKIDFLILTSMFPGALFALLENFTPVPILVASRLTAPGSPRMVKILERTKETRPRPFSPI